MGDSKYENFVWTKDRIYKLIDFFREHEFLYNLKHAEYKKKHTREASLNDLSYKLGCSITDVKDKWQNLRTYFTKEYKKVKRSRKSGSVYTPKWEFYNELKFVKEFNESEEEEYLSSPAEEDESDSSETSKELLKELDGTRNKNTRKKRKNGETSSSNRNWALVRAGSLNSTPKSSLPREAQRMLKEKTDEQVFDDAHYFGMQVASKLRALDNRTSDYLKIKILELIFQHQHKNTEQNVDSGSAT